MSRGVRKSITIPGLLAPAVKQRCAEFGHTIFTPYAVELVCYDLRSDANHEITVQIAHDTQAAQDAVDRELVAHYRPGQPRKGLLVQLLERVGHLQSVAARNRHEQTPPLSAVPERVTFPADIWSLADPRWQDLGYASLSAYITGLIRYDLLVGGPHASTTADCRSKLQRRLTRKTLADRRKGRRRKTLLDHLIEEKKGRPVPPEELERVKANIAQALRRISLAPYEMKACPTTATASPTQTNTCLRSAKRAQSRWSAAQRAIPLRGTASDRID